MPCRITASLEPSSELVYELPTSGRIVQHLFFSSIKAYSEELSRRIHSMRVKPYSVTRLTTAEENVKGKLARVKPGSFVKATFKILDDELREPLIKGLEEAELKVVGVKLDLLDIKATRTETYEEMLFRGRPFKAFSISTLTPVVFDEDSPFPEEAQPIFNRPILCWNSFSSESLRLPRSIIKRASKLKLVKHSLVRRVVPIPIKRTRIPIICFSGKLVYEMGALDFMSGLLLSALLRLANYSGIGSRTTMGFGSVMVRPFAMNKTI